jgi:NAD(P)H-dependent FMN reductase
MEDANTSLQTGEPRSIALIISSTRPTRIGHLIARHVTSQLTSSLSSQGIDNIRLSSIDLSAYPLPFCDEPHIPAHFPADDPTSHYAHAHTRAWSTEIRKHSAFIFITPQYNWGYPASLKNAIDYLFHEWGGKPALVVSYGGHGGVRAAAQLIQVLNGLRMKPLEEFVSYTIAVHETDQVRENGDFDNERKQLWKDTGSDAALETKFRELIALL